MGFSARLAIAAAGLAVLPAIVLAQAPSAPPPVAAPDQLAEGGRFVLRETPGGLLRMDGRTGQMSLCTSANGTFACRLVPDDRAALEAEVERLKAENEALRRGGAEARRPDAPALNLPSDQEVDRALSLAERILRRFMGIIRDAEQERQRGDRL